MQKFYTAIFTDKKTGNVIYRLDAPVFDEDKWPGYTKFEWRKAKALMLEKLIKDRFLNRSDIRITDHEGVNDFGTI